MVGKGLPFRDWSLRAKLLALLVLVSLLPLTGVALLDIHEARQRLVSNTSALLSARGDQLVGELDGFVRGYQNSIRRTAHLPPVLELFHAMPAEAEPRKAAVRALLMAQPETDERVRGAGLLDSTGTVLVATEAALTGKNLAFHGYVREALRGAAVISDVHLAEPEVGRAATVAFVEPVTGADRKPMGLFVLWVKASSLWDILEVSDALAGRGSSAVLLDQHGVRIGHTYSQDLVFHPAGALAPALVEAISDEQRFGDETRRLLRDVRPFPEQFTRARAKRPDTAMFRGLGAANDKWDYCVGRRLQTVPWTLFYMVPEQQLSAELAQMTWRRTGLATLTIALAMLVGVLFAGAIQRPIAALSAATQSISGGNLSARVRSSRNDEIGRLGASFDAMAERIEAQAGALRDANQELERKVVERTAALARATLALQESEESLAITIQSIGDGVIATDVDGRITRMNTVAEKLTGWPLADALGKPLDEVFQLQNEVTREPVESPVDKVLRDGTIVGLAHHTVLLARDGTARAVADSGAPIRDAAGVLRGVVLVFRDQTEERNAENTLRASEARKSAILEAALDCIVTMDRSGLITEFNPAAERTFGYARADVIGRPMAELLVPEALRERHLRGVEHYLATGVGPVLGRRIELEGLRADGTVFPIELAVVVNHSEEGPTFTATLRDLSARLKAELALHVSEARFRHLTESGIIGILVTDPSGNIEDANQEFLRILGFSREELGKVHLPALTPPEWRASDAAALEQFKTTGVVRPREKEYLRKDGTRVPVLVGAAMLDAPRCIAFVLDLSDQKRAQQVGEQAMAVAEEESAQRELAEQALRRTEQQLRQSQKMEAIGTLAGGIAHDFNNLLSVILSYSEMLLHDLPEADPMHAEIQQIARAGKRASELTRQLLVFSRRQVLQPSVVNLNEAISGMTSMLRRLIGEDVELVLLPAADLGSVYVDPTQMEQVLLNLVVNARDAMQRGGKLTIETGEVTLDPSYAKEHLGAEPGPYVVLSVSDTGTGMDRETQSRIFEPFFTTKGAGKGTGLGLSTVFGIVKQSGGSIWVYSELAKGTTFKVYLPRADAQVHAPDSAAPVSAPTSRGAETVLLVEDDEQVRSLASSILRKHGYRVLEASGGGDALLICEQYPLTIHLLLTDVIMPRMSGREVWARLSPLKPDMKVLFMSGYTDDAIVHHGVLSSEFAFVQKPLMPGPLLARVRSVLDGKSKSA